MLNTIQVTLLPILVQFYPMISKKKIVILKREQM